MQQIADVLKLTFASQENPTAEELAKIEAAKNSIATIVATELAEKVNTAKQEALISGRGQVASDVSGVLIDFAKANSVDLGDADLQKGKISDVLKAVLPKLKTTTPQNNDEAIRAAVNAATEKLKGEYEPIISEHKALKAEQATAKANAFATEVLSKVPNINTQSSAMVHATKLLLGEISGYATEEIEGVGTALKDKDGNFVKENGTLVTVQAKAAKIATDLSMVRKSEPGGSVNFGGGNGNDSGGNGGNNTNISNPFDYLKTLIK